MRIDLSYLDGTLDRLLSQVNLFSAIIKAVANNSEIYKHLFLKYTSEYDISLFGEYHRGYNELIFSDFYANSSSYIQILKDFVARINDIKTKLPVRFSESSAQYKNFVLQTFCNFNWNEIANLDSSLQTGFTKINDKIKINKLEFEQNDPGIIMNISQIVNVSQNYINVINDKINAVEIFEKIKDVKDNIVMIGANGSGKSTFAKSLVGTVSNKVTVISAQHILVYNQKAIKLSIDENMVPDLLEDIQSLTQKLFYEDVKECTNSHYNKDDAGVSILQKTISIWNKLIEHRKLHYEYLSLRPVTMDNIDYDFNLLSDGEKAIFFYVARVLLAGEDSYIIVDEPENHLHLDMCNRLWDFLEQERSDCKFIYLTHNLDFAVSRNKPIILWNKKFISPTSWEFTFLPKDLGIDEGLNERLLLEILGSQRKVMFCEGEKSSLDFKLLSNLFPTYIIIPVKGHLDVVNNCKAYNKRRAVYGRSAIGIIDSDFHTDEQLRSWEKKSIYHLDTYEIENLLCDEFILTKAIEYFRKCDPSDILNKLKARFFKELEKQKYTQATCFANERTNDILRNNCLKERKNIDKLVAELDTAFSKHNTRSIYEDYLSKIEDAIKKQDYKSAVRIVNIKKVLTHLANDIIVANYEDEILHYISINEELQEYISKQYFPFMKNT